MNAALSCRSMPLLTVGRCEEDVEKISGRSTIYGAMLEHCSYAHFKIGSAMIQTRGCWVECSNTTLMLCPPPSPRLGKDFIQTIEIELK